MSTINCERCNTDWFDDDDMNYCDECGDYFCPRCIIETDDGFYCKDCYKELHATPDGFYCKDCYKELHATPQPEQKDGE